MKFNIIKNNYPESIDLANKIEKELLEKGKWTKEPINPDYVFVIGGDGTFLGAVDQYNDKLDDIVFYPIKFGGIGFYTNHNNINEKNISEMICVDDCNVEELPLLELNIDNNETHYSINEIKVLNDLSPQELNVYINDEFLETFKGSGVAFSTPTGTTGFMKSIGGAIIYPKVKLFEMQEISPVSTVIFKTVNSPIIFGEEIIKLNKVNDNNELKIIIDARKIINSFKELKVKMSDKKLKVIRNKEEPSKAKLLNDIFVINRGKKNNS